MSNGLLGSGPSWDSLPGEFLSIGGASPAPASSRIGATRFTVEHLPPGQRHEAWANRNWPSVSPLYDTTPFGEFNSRSLNYALGDMKLWFSQITGQRYERTTRAARAHGFDHVCAFIGWAGSAVGEAGGRSYHRRPGDLILFDVAQGDCQIGNGDDCVTLMIPRALAETILPPVETLHGLLIPAEKAALLSSVLRGMRATLGGLDDSAVPRLRRVLLDILAVTLAEAGQAAEPDPAARSTTLALRACAGGSACRARRCTAPSSARAGSKPISGTGGWPPCTRRSATRASAG